MKLILEHLGSVVTESFLEPGKQYFVGRQSECDFVLEESSSLSRKHLKIYESKESGKWLVESISEWGGLYLKDKEVQLVEVESGVSLSLKNYTLKFVQEENLEKEDLKTKDNQNLLEEFSMGNSLIKKNEELTEDATKIEEDSKLLYSLYISIEGEFSNHVNLNIGDSWILGRSEECDISIDYAFLTRKHIQFLKKDSKFYVKDLGSANKTLLNGEELKSQKEVLLSPNDEVSVGDLNILFEIRNTQHSALIKNLPISVSDSQPISRQEGALMAFPKVVLEDSPHEDNTHSSKFFKYKKKKKFLLVIVPILIFAFYFKYQEDRKQKEKLALIQDRNNRQKEKLEAFYKEAINNLEKEKFQFCIEQLEELHKNSSTGFFRDSEQLLVQCQNGLQFQKQRKAQEEAEKLQQETELKISQLSAQCQKEFEENKIKTLEELNLCASELLALDPTNPTYTSIMVTIQERETLKNLEEQKQADYRKFIQGKRALYNKAKKLAEQKKVLKAVSAYNVFLKSSRSVASLKPLSEQAKQERDALQKEYDDELTGLYKSCESLIDSGNLREAYKDCNRILKFKNYDKKALDYIDKIKKNLKVEIKPLYEQSLWHESFSRIDEAIKIWREILAKDIKGGHYYKKAEFQIEKYK